MTSYNQSIYHDDEDDDEDDLEDLEDLDYLNESTRNQRWNHSRIDLSSHIEKLIHEKAFNTVLQLLWNYVNYCIHH